MLGNGSSELGGIGEDLSPFLDCSNVIAHALAGAEGLRELKDGERELKASLGNVVPTTLCEICNGLVDFIVHLDVALPAGLNFNEVVVSGHAVDETSDEVGDSRSAKAESLSGRNLNGTNSDGHEVSCDHTSLVELTKSPVSLQGGDVSLDGFSVKSVVLGNVSDEFGLALEDLSPLFESYNVNFGSLAVSDVSWKRLSELSESGNSSNVVAVKEVFKGILDVCE